MPESSPQFTYRLRKRYRLLTTASCAMLALVSAGACAVPLLSCRIEQGGTTQVLRFSPTQDPYTVQSVDINGRFRFKAVVVGDTLHIEYIKIYTYDSPKRQPVLLHEAKYLAPVANPAVSAPSLTGVNHIYSPRLERELQYECALLEDTP